MKSQIEDNLDDLRKLDLPFNIDEVEPVCHQCVRNQLKKYDNFVSKDGVSSKNKFQVMCRGIPKSFVDPVQRALLTEEQLEELEATLNPIKFAKKYLKNEKGEPFVARDYQEILLLCTSKRAVYRCSRRIGKTTAVVIRILHAIFTNKGLKVLVVGPQKKHAEDIFTRIREFIKNNPILSSAVSKDISSPYFHLQLKNGSSVKGFAGGTKGNADGTAIRGSDGDLILCLPKGTSVNTSEFGTRPIETLTLSDTVLGGDEDGVQVGEILQLIKRKSILITIPTVLGAIKCSPEHPLFDGKEDVPAKEAKDVIFSLYHKELKFSNRVILARLIGYNFGDGWMYTGKYGPEAWWSGQEKDLEQINEDINLLGDTKKQISTRYCENLERGIKGEGSSIGSRYLALIMQDHCPFGRKVYQQLKVPDIIKNGHKGAKAAFLSGLFSAESTGLKYQINRKTPRTIDFSMKSSKEEWIKNWINDIAELLDEFDIEYNLKFDDYFDDIFKEQRYTGYIIICNNLENLKRFIKRIGFCYNAEKTASANKFLLYSHYKENWKKEYWKLNRKIRNNLTIPRQEVMKKYNVELHIVKHHRKLYNKLYSEKLLTFDEYIKTLTWKEGYVRLPVIKENVRFSTEEVDVYNLTSGASNRYFASGIFTHNCEEMDFVDNEAIQGAILPILYTNANAELIGFSTPCGLRKTFYSLCLESPQYKEFHYNYKVLPWAELIEKERGSYTEEQWIHEFCLDGNTLVATLNGLKHIRNITKEDILYSGYKNSNIPVINKAEIRRRNTEVINIKTWTSNIICTPDHNFKDLESNSKISANNSDRLFYKHIPNYTKNDKNAIYARLIGFLNGDGYIGKRIIEKHFCNGKYYYYKDKPMVNFHSDFYSKNKIDIEQIQEDLKVLFPESKCTIRLKKTKENYDDSWMVSVSKKDSQELINRGGIVGIKTEQDFDIPRWIQENDFYMSEYIAALFGAEGSTPRPDNHYNFCTLLLSTSKINKKDITPDRHLVTIKRFLNKIGIKATIKAVERDVSDVCGPDSEPRIVTTLYILNQRNNLINFFTKIGYRYAYNKEILTFKALKYYDYYNALLQEQENIIDFCKENKDKFTWQELSDRFDVSKTILLKRSIYQYKDNQFPRISKRIIKDLLTVKQWFGKYAVNDYIFEPILEKNKVSNRDVYNITVGSEDHSYLLADGLVTYNCAEFGSSDAGVYKPSYIDKSIHDYKYSDNIPTAGWTYAMGVDWNEKHGAEIAIVGYSPLKKKFRVVDIQHVVGSEFTQLNSVSKAIEVNNKWVPNFVYCDAGNGATAYELLMKTAYKHATTNGNQATAKLLKTLRKYDSGASIEVTDTVTHEKVKKAAKSFMVNASVRLFEQQRIETSAHDKDLEKQLRNYIIERITPTGNPVYGMEDKKVGDHRLDAVNLAIVAFQLEFDELFKQTYSAAAGSAPDPRRISGIDEKGNITKVVERPKPRDFGGIKNQLEQKVFPLAAGNLNDRLQGIKTSRPGWDTDEEDVYIERFLQKRYSRNGQIRRLGPGRPRRTNI